MARNKEQFFHNRAVLAREAGCGQWETLSAPQPLTPEEYYRQHGADQPDMHTPDGRVIGDPTEPPAGLTDEEYVRLALACLDQAANRSDIGSLRRIEQELRNARMLSGPEVFPRT